MSLSKFEQALADERAQEEAERAAERAQQEKKEQEKKMTSTNGNRDYPNSGILFRSDRQRTERDPGYTGNGDLTCPNCNKRSQFFVNAWVKTAKTGTKFFSLSFKPKNAQSAGAAAANTDDDIRF
jgi:hypothetical protein